MTAYFPAARLRRAAFVGALCAGLAVTGTGCGADPDPDKGTNGVGKLSADQIEDKARAAATAADSVHLSGTLVSGGKTFTLDMRLKSDGGSGEVKSQEDTFQLLRVGEQLYLKASAAFWGKSDSAGKLGDKYVKVPEGDPSYKQFRGFTDMDVLLDGLLGLEGKLTKGETYTKVGHTRAVQLAADAGKGGKLSVSLEGTPYPLVMERAGGAGRVELGEWGKTFQLDPPEQDQTVDYGSQLPTTKEAGSGGSSAGTKGSGQGTDPSKG
ncbi:MULTISPECIES: hypothetical protein [unclassified Streptomyces]|uniref:hypothetical protein n=1 Tax=unclassified Streptomyces TaxID=2593676 RepID=UPI001BE9CA24|nr:MULTISPECIES: hypothetical protein [unclassified Streptomyces]MBT2402989.1 hypothetical protein [Streptomyces sp. ISL-21]MBT2455349.1 hypothetical protein [Streptomyces sp. ISL-86]MBT2609642.1 hypothetical protein [Streptomyces sp. ISL-87]